MWSKRLRSLFAGVGAALRYAYHSHAEPRSPAEQLPPLAPSADLEEAVGRVRVAARGMEFLAALTLNPADPRALDAGVDHALRRITEDIGG